MGSKISPTLLDDLEKNSRVGLQESKGCMYGYTEVDNQVMRHSGSETLSMSSLVRSRCYGVTAPWQKSSADYNCVHISHAPCRPFIIRQKRSRSVHYLISNTWKIWFIYCWMRFLSNNWPKAKGFRCSSQCDIKIDLFISLVQEWRVKSDIQECSQLKI